MILYLTPSEKALYDKLPATLKKEWGGEVVEEKGTAWETEDEWQVRLRSVVHDSQPAFRQLAETVIKKMKSKNDPDMWTMKEIPEDILPTVFFLIGAVGMSTIIFQGLGHLSSSEMIEDLATLSFARHQMLKSNALFSVRP